MLRKKTITPEFINRLIEISKKGKATEEDIHYFLPDFPAVSGEIIRSQNIYRKYSLNTCLEIIKGYHMVELRYREMRNSDFGFGSPSRTHQWIVDMGKNNKFAKIAERWIARNGGNYYIKEDFGEGYPSKK